MVIESGVIRYGDHVDTDVIIPARYLNMSGAADLAAHCMEDIDADFGKKAESAHIIVAGRNFGCGSSREHAPIAIKAAGIRCVIAHSFARIFYRNAINIGLPIVECPEAGEALAEGDVIAVDLDTGVITGRNGTYRGRGFPPFMRELIELGGLAAYASGQLEAANEG